jgi:perosamine synthetase
MNNIKDLTKDPFGKYNGNELKYVAQVLDSEDRECIPFVGRLENAFAERFEAKYAIAQNSGTATLHSCLAAGGVGAGDEVISPAQTVIMCSFAALHQNAIPVYADIEADSFNIDPQDIERKITPKTKAIIAVHMHGLPANMPEIMKIAKKHNLFVVEDSAQCVLGTIDGKLAGTFGHVASFSFETKKHLSVGEGGMVTTNDKELATNIRKIAGLGYKTLGAGDALRQLLPEEFQNPDYKRHDTLGWNYRMNEISAAVGLAQLERVELLVKRRQEVASYFQDALDNCDWLIPQKSPQGFVNSWWTFTVRYKGHDKYKISWNEFWERYKVLGGDGFYGGLSVAYQEPIMINQPFKQGYLPASKLYENAFQYAKGECPVAEKLQPEMMQFKTNYRSLEKAKVQAQLLNKLVRKIEGNGC